MNEKEAREQAERSMVGMEEAPTPIEWPQMRRAIINRITTALHAASNPPPGHIIDSTGTVRKVDGALILTEDGRVIGRKLYLNDIPLHEVRP